MPLVPGMRLGPYQILAPLGAGGMGEVYRARDSRLDRDVAIKVLPEDLARDSEALARFEREAKVLAALSHPNILSIFDFGREQGVSFAVTELLEGETLGSRIARSSLPWPKAVEITIAVADGLAAAHSKEIIHRDLKPDNIFLSADGRVKILDFGLARWKPSARPQQEAWMPTAPAAMEASTGMGTVGYMSPEQVLGIAADAPSDIFSLGCVLYEMVTGHRAFSRQTAAQTTAAVLEAQPTAVSTSGKVIPPALERVLTHCLEKNPQERFHSAHDLAFDLRAILGGGRPWKYSFPLSVLRSRPALSITVALAALLAGAVLYWSIGFQRPSRAIDSLAVLPFTNLSSDPNAEYLSDGITEGIINSLSQLPQLQVTARSTVFRYKGRDTDPLKVGRELNVRAVLTGKVVQRGNLLNIQAELVSVSSGAQLWGQQYNRKISDVVTVQEEISTEISEKLRVRLTGEEQKRLTKRYTENAEAYQLYLQGRYHWNKRTEEGLRKGIEYFAQAMTKDPGYALAYAGLADCYGLLNIYGALPPKESFPIAKFAAMKALEIDEKLPEAHVSLGRVAWQYDWDWAGAEREFKRAIALNPAYATAHQSYAFLLVATKRFDEALPEIHRAQELDRFSVVISSNVAGIYYRVRQYDRAVELFHKTLEMEPNFPWAHRDLGLAYEEKSMFPQAIVEFQKTGALSGGNPEALEALGHAYAVSGRQAEAKKILGDLKELSKSKYVSPYGIAAVYAGLDDKDQALQWLERAYEEHSGWISFLQVEPRFDLLRPDPRFQNLLRRIGFAP